MPQQLLALLSNDFSSRDVDALRTLADRLAAQGPWSREAPRFVDDTWTAEGDQPVRTVGLVLMINSPGEHPATPVQEATRMIDALAIFTQQRGVSFELELDQDLIGQIVDGAPDRFIREGLLDAW